MQELGSLKVGSSRKPKTKALGDGRGGESNED